VPHLVVAPDKFRGTASAGQAAAAAAGVARRAGWTADEVPMSDGGEGLLNALGGESRHTTVTGPLGEPVDAEWRLLPDAAPLTAVIEMSKAAGRALVPHPHDEDPVDAVTTGVGQLLLAARDAGARRIVIGCGGSATTDGGWGAFEAVTASAAASSSASSGRPLDDIELVVACDVTTPFLQAATIFGPQKGATEKQVARLTARLEEVAARYRTEAAVDVTTITGAGAAGGLAGGLVALGARIEPGFDLVARIVHLAERMDQADLVITGEGHVDPPSFEGKVPGGVLHLARTSTRTKAHGVPVPVVCIGGGVDRSVLAQPPPGLEVISLSALFGPDRARSDTLELIAEVTAGLLPRFCP
jgi:glycerate 2-kinase